MSPGLIRPGSYNDGLNVNPWILDEPAYGGIGD